MVEIIIILAILIIFILVFREKLAGLAVFLYRGFAEVQ